MFVHFCYIYCIDKCIDCIDKYPVYRLTPRIRITKNIYFITVID